MSNGVDRMEILSYVTTDDAHRHSEGRRGHPSLKRIALQRLPQRLGRHHLYMPVHKPYRHIVAVDRLRRHQFHAARGRLMITVSAGFVIFARAAS